jgi:hypothetical protein
MKHILFTVGVALPLVCGAGIAMAQPAAPPPLSGPGSVFPGNPDVAPRAQARKSKSKQKLQEPRSRLRQAPKKQSE